MGLLKQIHGRWACLPLAFALYLRRTSLAERCIRVRGKAVVFGNKFTQAMQLIARLGAVFADVPVLVVADSWFGNNGLFKPLRERLGARVKLLLRPRVNATLYAIPAPHAGRPGRPRKYGKHLGSATELTAAMREQARTYPVHVYGARREVQAADRIVMLKTQRCRVRVVCVFRKSQWVALVTTDLNLSVAMPNT